MSRVFAATETALGRRVVIKVLPPELAEGLSVERFKREIQLAARLQNPHIVPVLTAGEMHGLPYYTMPFVNGHSLRARLVNAGPLPVSEVISILRDVARALTCAHEEGVVHRDIKPDNVLLSGGSAVVTDFGVAKALSESKKLTPGGTLTHVGTSLGTPAYMAPEQAAADTAMDHRADIYSFGVMGYELLAGQPPFHGRTPQKLLLAQMGERPLPIEETRADTPALLAQLIMKCLEKEPIDRPQTATELVRALEQVTNGGGIPAMPAILLGGRRRLGRALVFYALAYAAVAIVARAAVIAIGLPTWVFPAAIALMALGLPIILATAFVHHGVQLALTTAATTTGGSSARHSTMTKLAVKAGPWVSWRRIAVGGAISLGALALFVLVFMLMRAFGIGPAGSLLASGKLGKKDRLLVADFRSSGPDTSLGSVMTEAVRTDLGQSQAISLVTQSAVTAALKLMQRPDTGRLDVSLAREIAQREGLGAVVDGDIRPLGGGFVLTLRLLAAQTGDALAAYQATIDNTSQLLPTIDVLTRKLRAKIGESLKSVAASAPLEEVTTRSLEALKRYDAGVHAISAENDNVKGIRLFQEAIAIDTGFAMAYRKLGIVLSNEGRQREEVDSALTRAYRHRDRLPDRERLLTTASYFSPGPGHDRGQAVAALESLLEMDSLDEIGLGNLAYIEQSRRNYSRAEVLFGRMYKTAKNEIDSANNLASLVVLKVDQQKLSEAATLVTRGQSLFPKNEFVKFQAARVEYARGHEDSAVLHLEQVRSGTDARLQIVATNDLGDIAQLHGKLAKLAVTADQLDSLVQARGIPTTIYRHGIDDAFVDAWYRQSPKKAVAVLDSLLTRNPLSSVQKSQRPYLDLAGVYAVAGRPDKARELLKQYATDVSDSATIMEQEFKYRGAMGEIALAENRPLDAIRQFALQDQRADGPTTECEPCQLPNIGRAYDRAGIPDSTVSIYERFLAAPRDFDFDALYLARIHERLGELYEKRGDIENARKHFGAFVELWGDADADLAAQVQAARTHLARLEQSEEPVTTRRN